MGVEPTAACSVQPATGFEDREAHQDLYTPATEYSARESLCLDIRRTIFARFHRWHADLLPR